MDTHEQHMPSHTSRTDVGAAFSSEDARGGSLSTSGMGSNRPSNHRHGGGGRTPSSGGRGQKPFPVQSSGDVRVFDQHRPPAAEVLGRAGTTEHFVQVSVPERLRREPHSHSNRGIRSRRGRRGGYQGIGRDAPHGGEEQVADEALNHIGELRERDAVEGREGETSLQRGTLQGGINTLQTTSNENNGRPTLVSGYVRIETPDQDGGHPSYSQFERRDGGRRGSNARERSGGRLSAGAENGNWRRMNPPNNRLQSSNPESAAVRNGRKQDTGHNRLPHTEHERESTGLRKEPGEKISVPQLVQELELKLTKGKIECLICYDIVGRNAPVWSCISCFSIFHLPCIKKWARAPMSSDFSVLSSGPSEGNWRCPGCQTVQFISANELRYYCFCGQVEEPSLDYYISPHSCGGPCRKPLDKGKNSMCKHHCTMQCHPGPCPPCTALAPPQPCPCGKTTYTRRCSEQGKGASSCGQQCGRPLFCGRHVCEQTCHEGACQSCDVRFNAKCFCQRQQEDMLCGYLEPPGQINLEGGVFSCKRDCFKKLRCGKHECKEKCHPGFCGECELSPSVIFTCPCGKKSLSDLLGLKMERQSCTDPIHTCNQACGKFLPCKKHLCTTLCHMGPCPLCEVLVEQKCRCGASSRTVACFVALKGEGVVQKGGMSVEGDVNGIEEDLFLCDRKCGKKKNCGRHRCNDRCCSAANFSDSSRVEGIGGFDPHICALPCGKKLRCKQHNCQELCHAGHCPPCMETTFSELACACGQTSIPPPVPCGTPFPSCQYPCSIPQVCDHEATHLCHFGDCPPCTIPVAKECVGSHVVLRGVPCGSRDIKCNKLCGKTRQCGLHACARTCHLPPCDSGESETSSQKQSSHSCGQPCGAPRRECSHTCASPCHPITQCPEIPCRVTVTITCLCGRLTAEVPCGAGGANTRGATEAAAMVLSRLPGPLQPLEGKDRERVPFGQRKLACDNECAKFEKKRLLADAFGATPLGEGFPGLEGGVVGSEMLAEFARREPQWITAIEDRFKYLVQGPKSGTGAVGNLRLHVFCGMVKERREAIYQMAERWGLTVTGVGREPRRFVIAHVTSKSKVPSRSLFTKASPAGGATPIRAPPFNPTVDMEPGLVVALFDLPREADVSTLVLRFGGECELVWLNDKNALAIFADAGRAATALRRVDHASSYRGATGMAPAGGSSLSRGSAWGTQTMVAAGNKTTAMKKGIQDSNWVEDAWGDDQRWKQEAGAWQSKVLPVTISKSPWSALSESAPAAIGGASEGSSSWGRPSVSAQTSVSNPDVASRVDSIVVPVRVAGRLGISGQEASGSGPTLLPVSSADEEDDDWEKALEG